MHGIRFTFVCTLNAFLGVSFLPVYAQVPQAVPASKQSPAPAEKSVLAESPKLSAQAAPPPKVASTDFCQCVGARDNVATQRIEHALDGPLHKVGLDYADQPLEDVTAQLSDEYGVPIVINVVALENAGIKPDLPVTINVHNLSLRSGLRLMLKSRQLTYIIEDEVLCITTPEEADKTLKICVYDVRRIAGERGDLRPLIDTISSCVAKDTWTKNGKGNAEIRSPKPGLLVITQTQAVHDDIRNLLMKLDDMHREHSNDAGGAPPKATTGSPADRYAPPAPAAPRKADTFVDPAPSEKALDPFGG